MTGLHVTANGASDDVTLHVRFVPVQRVAVTPASVTVPLGESKRLVCAAMLDTQRLVTVEGEEAVWISSEPLVATVDPTGRISGWSAGVATISCLVRGVVGAAEVTIGKAAQAGLERSGAISLHVGESAPLIFGQRLTDGSFAMDPLSALVSSAEAIAQVTTDGVVSALSPGDAVVTGVGAGAAVEWPVQVLPAAPDQLSCSALALSLSSGERLAPALRATFTDGTSRDLDAADAVDWRPDADDVVRFDRGTLVPIREGGATVWAYFGGVAARCSVEVTP